MKRLKNLPESDFLKLFFSFLSLCLLIGAAAMPDRAQMLTGLWKIMASPCRISTNYFAVGGYAATFLNMGLVGICCTLLYVCLRARADRVSVLAFLLTVGFGSWGIHPLNTLPTVLGVVLYGLVKKERMAGLVNAMLFSTGIAPLLSELMVRYPDAATVGFSLPGVAAAVVTGLAIGFFIPAGLENAPKVHHGFDLYSAAVPVGMTAFLLQTVFYEVPGVALPPVDAAQLRVGSRMAVNLFCGSVFLLCIVAALLLGCRIPAYFRFLRGAFTASVSAQYGNAMLLMNTGVYGLFILLYYNAVNASFNGVTFGLIFCMLACCDSGAHPGTVLPEMAGYVAAAWVFSKLSPLLGGTFVRGLNAQPIVIGLCYASGLAPITGAYGWQYGFLAAALHYCLVTTVPSLHGGFCLYNGGFTAAFVCLLFVPVLKRFCHTKEERLAKRRMPV